MLKTIQRILAPGFILGMGLVAAAEVEIDAVAAGKTIFETVGCFECHTVEKDDDSFKTGPGLYGLFLTNPRERKVMVDGKETTIKADRAYFERSLRKAADELAISEVGPTKGTAYQPIMPTYVKGLVSDEDLDALYHYLRTLADGPGKGPDKVMVKRKAERKHSDPLKIRDEEIVTDRTRVFRIIVPGTSVRSIHVGQVNGVSYTFDPRMLSVRRIWSGGFLNLGKERRNRGQGLASTGHDAVVHTVKTALLQPLTNKGEAVDFEFKEPDAEDFAAIERYLRSEVDFADRMAAVDAEFLGYRVGTGAQNPAFRFRVGQNSLEQTTSVSEEGNITIVMNGEFKEAQKFQIGALDPGEVKVQGGSLEKDIWTIPAGTKTPVQFEANIPMSAAPRAAIDQKENWAPQKLVTRPAKKPKKMEIELPAGYSMQDWLSPVDLLGREQLFEPTGIAVAKDGTIVLSTRTAGIWRIRDSQWTLFAEGTQEALGVCIEDDKGDVIVISQKPEVTRIRDVDGDGRADLFETVSDDFGFHGNYSEYTHGPVKDAAGNYYFLLNLAHHGSRNKEAIESWQARGKYMGSMGAYRGWAMRVTPDGKTEPFAMGLRSPAGLGAGPDGRIWYAENQGEYVGSSFVVPLEKGDFYGHPSSLVSLPGKTPDSPEFERRALPEHWADKVRTDTIWLPHSLLANSPGNPTWDLTGGKFGAFQGQMFIGDQTLSQMMRVVPEEVDGQNQGCAIRFASGMASGIMRPVFLPDGSLLMGQTGRGWRARGGDEAALQQIIYDGKTVHADIHNIRATPSGFAVDFTAPLDSKVSGEQLKKLLKMESWGYFFFRAAYGSPPLKKREETITSVSLSADRKTMSIELEGFGKEGEDSKNSKGRKDDKDDKGGEWVDRIYQIQIPQAPTLFGDVPAWMMLEGFYTLRAIPGAK